jgi:hypothetical protein
MVRDTGRRHDKALMLASLALSLVLAMTIVIPTATSATVAGAHLVAVAAVNGRDGLPSVDPVLGAAGTNGPPAIDSMTPSTGSRFKSGASITFEATATDPDGDPLIYTWKDGGRVLGTGSYLLFVGMPDGRHTVTLNVTDGKNWSARSIDMVVEEGQGRSWALPVMVVLVALVAIAGVSVYLRRR